MFVGFVVCCFRCCCCCYAVLFLPWDHWIGVRNLPRRVAWGVAWGVATSDFLAGKCFENETDCCRGEEWIVGGGMAAKKTSAFFTFESENSDMGESVSFISGVNEAARLMMRTNRFNLRETDRDVCSKLAKESWEATKSFHRESKPFPTSTRSSSIRSRVS